MRCALNGSVRVRESEDLQGGVVVGIIMCSIASPGSSVLSGSSADFLSLYHFGFLIVLLFQDFFLLLCVFLLPSVFDSC